MKNLKEMLPKKSKTPKEPKPKKAKVKKLKKQKKPSHEIINIPLSEIEGVDRKSIINLDGNGENKAVKQGNSLKILAYMIVFVVVSCALIYGLVSFCTNNRIVQGSVAGVEEFAGFSIVPSNYQVGDVKVDDVIYYSEKGENNDFYTSSKQYVKTKVKKIDKDNIFCYNGANINKYMVCYILNG